MVNGIVYIFSFLAFVINIMLFPKKEKNTMLLTEGSIAVMSVMCIGVCAAQIYSLIEIPVNLLSISVVYIVASLTIFLALLKIRKVQKFYINKWQIFSVMIMAVVFLIFELGTYSYELRASFCNMHDASGHFEMAMNVMRWEKVSGMPFAPFHNAMMIEIVSPFLPEYKYYKGYVLAEVLHYFFEMIFFYSLILEFNNRKSSRYIAPVITLLYWLGYPLYSFAIGDFTYWSWGVLICGYVIYLAKEIPLCKSKLLYGVGIMLGLVGVLECYMLFAPVMVLVIAVLLYPTFFKQKSVNCKKNLAVIIVSSVILLICICITFYMFFIKSNLNIFDALREKGWIYSNIGNDFFLTLPLIISFVCYAKDKKSYSMYLKTLICIGISVFFMLFLTVIDFMSVYYYAKFYYLLWFFWWIVIANALDTIEVKNNERRYAKIYGLLLALAYICCFGRIDKIVPKELLINDSGLIGTGIYTYNFSFIDNDYEDYEYPTENIELNSYVIDITKDGKNAVLIDYIDGNKSIYDARWFRAMTGCTNTDSNEWKKIIENDKFYDYYVVIKDSIVYNEAKEYIGKYNIVYENEAGIVISK